MCGKLNFKKLEMVRFPFFIFLQSKKNLYVSLRARTLIISFHLLLLDKHLVYAFDIILSLLVNDPSISVQFYINQLMEDLFGDLTKERVKKLKRILKELTENEMVSRYLNKSNSFSTNHIILSHLFCFIKRPIFESNCFLNRFLNNYFCSLLHFLDFYFVFVSCNRKLFRKVKNDY